MVLRKLALIVCLAPVFWLAQVHALGLGEIDVRSRLNQRFSATIPVVSASADDIESLSVRLASAEDFDRGGVERADYLTSLAFSLDPVGHVTVSSRQIAREPLLNFIVEARWRGGRLLREYTVFLDPPGVAAAEPAAEPLAAAAPPVLTAPAPQAVRPTPPAPGLAAPTRAVEPAATEPETAVESATAGSYGPVTAQETLWSIGVHLRPGSDVTMDQVLLALYQNNPQAFAGGIGSLQKGARLRVPDAATMRTVDPETARLRVAQLRGIAATPKAGIKPLAPKPAVAPAATAAAPVDDVADRLAAHAETPKPPANASAKPVAAEAAAAAAVVATPPGPAPASLSAADAAKTGNDTGVPASAPTAASEPAAAGPTATAGSPAVAAASTNPASAAAAPTADEGLLDGLLIPLLAVLVIVLLIGLLLWRRRQRPEPAPVVLTPKSNLRPGPTMAGLKPAADTEAPARPMPPAPPAFDAGSALPAAAALGQSSKKSSIDTLLSGHDDFDGLATQTEASPLTVGLDANDPVSEADFHLAYALYDEAASLLKRAIAKDPSRAALHVKLAETYFAAKKPLEFQEAAETMQFRIPAADWQKVSQMGRKLCPDSQLFGAPASVDPVAAPVIGHGLSLEPPPRPPMPEPQVLELPVIAEPPAAPPPPSVALIDFETQPNGKPAATVAPAVPVAAAAAPDLATFDREAEQPRRADRFGMVDFKLDDLDFPPPAVARPRTTTVLDDEAGTKLDLARAYSDMGDNEAARSLLDEVAASGSPAQKQEAETLSKRLSA